MATNFIVPEYFDIILLMRRYNMNYRDGDGRRIDYRISDSTREKCRKLEGGPYMVAKKDIDELVHNLLLIRRASSGEERAYLDIDYSHLSRALLRVVRKGMGSKATDKVEDGPSTIAQNL
jgi:hypothetical protein